MLLSKPAGIGVRIGFCRPMKKWQPRLSRGKPSDWLDISFTDQTNELLVPKKRKS
jgi:hypothetical protein